jgi:RTX calcium-binding nonapeptide repeat (4 copies)
MMMKRAILIAITVMAACAAPVANAAERELNVLLTGGPEANVLEVKLSPDGRSYLIDSLGPLEAGGGICTHPEAAPHELVCEAAPIASFEINVGSGNDSAIISPKITVPATLRGGPGNDRLRGGGGGDKLVGGPGDDALAGYGSEDWIFGGSGDDWLYGGPGADRLNGGPGADFMRGGPGEDQESTDSRDYRGVMPHARGAVRLR